MGFLGFEDFETGEFEQELFFSGVLEAYGGFAVVAGAFHADDFAETEAFVLDVLTGLKAGASGGDAAWGGRDATELAGGGGLDEDVGLVGFGLAFVVALASKGGGAMADVGALLGTTAGGA